LLIKATYHEEIPEQIKMGVMAGDLLN